MKKLGRPPIRYERSMQLNRPRRLTEAAIDNR